MLELEPWAPVSPSARPWVGHRQHQLPHHQPQPSRQRTGSDLWQRSQKALVAMLMEFLSTMKIFANLPLAFWVFPTPQPPGNRVPRPEGCYVFRGNRLIMAVNQGNQGRGAETTRPGRSR